MVKRENHWWRSEKAWKGEFFENMILKSNDEEEKRIQNLRKEILFRPNDKFGKVSIWRAKLMTDSYINTEGENPIIRRAKAIYNIFSKIPIWIEPYQLIIGSPSGEPHGTEVEIEFSASWMEKEVFINGKKMSELEGIAERDVQSFILNEEDKNVLIKDILPYWKGKDLASRVDKEVKISFPKDYSIWKNFDVALPITSISPSHTIQDYATVIKKGLKGIKKEIQEAMNKLGESNLSITSKYDRKLYYQGMLICIEGLILYSHRCANFARKIAKTETKIERKEELLKIRKEIL